VVSLITEQQEFQRLQAQDARDTAARLGLAVEVLFADGNAVLQIPPDTSVAQQRLHGAEDVTRGAGIGFEVVSGDWTEAGGEKAVASWLRLKRSEALRVDLVGSQNDAMAVGARRAIAGLRPDWTGVRFTGCDGLTEGGRRLVDQGLLAATVVTPSNTGPTLERLAVWLRGGQLPPRDILLEPHSYPSEALVRP
jgi:ABC-type sugar transport system substrate-binding protein